MQSGSIDNFLHTHLESDPKSRHIFVHVHINILRGGKIDTYFQSFPFRVEHIKYRLPIQNIHQILSYPHWKSINVWVCCLIEELLSLIILQSRAYLSQTQIFSFYLIFCTKPKIVLHTLITNRFSVHKVLITIFGLLLAVQNRLQIIWEVRS